MLLKTIQINIEKEEDLFLAFLKVIQLQPIIIQQECIQQQQMIRELGKDLVNGLLQKFQNLHLIIRLGIMLINKRETFHFNYPYQIKNYYI